MDDKNLNYFQKLYRSMFDFNQYRKFAHETTKSALVYLLLCTLFLGGLGLIRPLYDYNKRLNLAKIYLVSEAPHFQFKDGNLSVDATMPLIVNDKEGSVVIIDTRDNADESIIDRYNTGIFIGKNKIIDKSNGWQKRTTDLSVLQGITLDNNSLLSLMGLGEWFNIAIVIVLLITFFLGKLFSALFLALIGVLINSFKTTSLKFKNIFSISIYALTLPMVFKVIVESIPISIPMFSLIYYIVAAIYIGKALFIIKYDETFPIV